MAFEILTPPKPVMTSVPPDSTTPGPSPAAQAGTVSEAEAIAGAAHTKMNVFSVSEPPKPGQPGAAPGTPGGSSVQLGGIVQGRVAVDLMDALLPGLIVLGFYKMSIETKKSDFQLTQGEKNTLYPIVDQCLNSINLNFESPWTALTVALITIYGGKAAEKGGIAWMDKKAVAGRVATPESVTKKPPLKVVPPEPINPAPASTNTDSFGTASGPATWTEADVKLVAKKRHCSDAKALGWLQRNWVKRGGVI